jgi:hypothetical protein
MEYGRRARFTLGGRTFRLPGGEAATLLAVSQAVGMDTRLLGHALELRRPGGGAAPTDDGGGGRGGDGGADREGGEAALERRRQALSDAVASAVAVVQSLSPSGGRAGGGLQRLAPGGEPYAGLPAAWGLPHRAAGYAELVSALLAQQHGGGTA